MDLNLFDIWDLTSVAAPDASASATLALGWKYSSTSMKPTQLLKAPKLFAMWFSPAFWTCEEGSRA